MAEQAKCESNEIPFVIIHAEKLAFSPILSHLDAGT